MRTFDAIFAMMDPADQNSKAIIEFHRRYQILMKERPASANRHHRWPGGYYIHILEVCNNVIDVIDHVPMMQDVDFSIEDAVLVAYFHDVDKLFYRYKMSTERPSQAQENYAKSLGINVAGMTRSSISSAIDIVKNGGQIVDLDLIAYGMDKRVPDLAMHEYDNDGTTFIDTAQAILICSRNGISLSDQAAHAIMYHQGGWSVGITPGTKISPLAAILHSADLLSTFAQNGRIVE